VERCILATDMRDVLRHPCTHVSAKGIGRRYVFFAFYCFIEGKIAVLDCLERPIDVATRGKLRKMPLR